LATLEEPRFTKEKPMKDLMGEKREGKERGGEGIKKR